MPFCVSTAMPLTLEWNKISSCLGGYLTLLDKDLQQEVISPRVLYGEISLVHILGFTESYVADEFDFVAHAYELQRL